jgi:hypothetical protein
MILIRFKFGQSPQERLFSWGSWLVAMVHIGLIQAILMGTEMPI